MPQNVTIGSSTTTATVNVSAGKVGFALDATGSGLNNLVIDGSTNTATTGIAVYGGSAAQSTQVQSVTVQNFLATGILVGALNKAATSGAVTLGPGLVVTGNGTSAKPAPGVTITSGMAIITGTAGAGTAGHTSIHNNTQHGVLVLNSGYVQINPGNAGMSASAAGQAYVDLDENTVAGLFIAQNPALVTALGNTDQVQDVEIVGISGGNGIHVEGGSFLNLIGSYVVGNKASGVYIGTYGNGATANNSIAGINLGTSAVLPGLNTLQSTASPNANAGVCLGIPAAATTGQTLSAAGNIWDGVNCVTTAGVVSHTGGCAAGSDTDIGGIGGGGGGNKNTANVSTCTLQ